MNLKTGSRKPQSDQIDALLSVKTGGDGNKNEVPRVSMGKKIMITSLLVLLAFSMVITG